MKTATTNDDAVRPYAQADRDSVRAICCDTVDRGEPSGNLIVDRAFTADIVTRYYTDIESECSWVAESGSRVVGYVNGSLSTRRYARLMALRIVPASVVQAAFRGALLRTSVWHALLAYVRNLRGQTWQRRACLDAFPAHLHINLLKHARGRGLGSRLLRTFLDYAASRRVPGVHATVRADNPSARHFFEREGFSAAGSFRRLVSGHEGAQEGYVVIYVRSMAA